MRPLDFLTHILPRALLYPLVRRGWLRPIAPLTLTFSVTAACQSRCKTCRIGEIWAANPGLKKLELTLDEIETVFRSLGESLGPVYFFNISGGEPFMRNDLPEIVALACRYLRPRLIHIPTNALTPKRIAGMTARILQAMSDHGPPGMAISIKPSIDGLGSDHDEIRGAPGNFVKLEETLDLLDELRRRDPRLHLDLGTVVSRFNLERIDAIRDWVRARGVDSYLLEVAEQRHEFHNQADPIIPSADQYATLLTRFRRDLLQRVGSKSLTTRMAEAVRLTYYDVALAILREKRQVTPCNAGVANLHLNYDGALWSCATLGAGNALGNVRDWKGDLRGLLGSEQAAHARRFIFEKRCHCPLQDQWLVNIVVTPRWMVRAGLRFLGFALRRRRGGDINVE